MTRSEFLRCVADLRPDWMADALCAEFGVDLWFPTIGQSNQPALDICGRCPVRVECLTWAIRNGIRYGIWGRMSTPRLDVLTLG
ncbi:MAG: WhiB family transcriptional regulator [Ilumatobacter sp.]